MSRRIAVRSCNRLRNWTHLRLRRRWNRRDPIRANKRWKAAIPSSCIRCTGWASTHRNSMWALESICIRWICSWSIAGPSTVERLIRDEHLLQGRGMLQQTGVSNDLTSGISTSRMWRAMLTMSVDGGIMLQKSFWGADRKFLEPLVRLMLGDVRDHISSSKIDHGPP